jgi:xylulokinase
MPSTPLLVGLDVGTTTVKAIVFDPAGQAVAQAGVPTPTHYPRPGWAYYEPEELWQSVVQALRQVAAHLDDPSAIAGVAVASIGETAMPLDAHGEPVHSAIAWFDTRTEPQARWLDETIGRDRLFAISGLALQPIFGLCKLLWLRQNEPERFARMAHWLNTADYIAYRLSGVAATDTSLASRTLALDIRRLQWAEELLLQLEISPTLFAPLRTSGSDLGPVTPEAAQATGLPMSARVGVGGHDHVCGALALGVTEPGMALDSLGTAEAMFVPLAAPISDPQMGYAGYAQGVHVDGAHYYGLGGLFTSGACIDWFRRAVAGGVAYETLIAEAEATPPGSLGVCFMPHLRLANPPNLDPKSRGAFIGLNADAGRGALFRALLEGLALEIRNALESLQVYSGAPLHTVYATGGGTRNQLLMQIKASVFNQTLHVVSVQDATALGAAVLGGLAAGIYADAPSALAALHFSQTPVEPIPAQVEFYDNLFRQVYQQMYATLRPLNHRLDELKNHEWSSRR